MCKGEVVAIFIAPERSVPLVPRSEILAVAGKGLEGDRYFNGVGTYSKRPEPGRQVTLIEIEALDALKRDLDIELGLGESRRNIVTRGVALNHLVGKKFRVGPVTMLGMRLTEPCSYLEGLTQTGVHSALEHRAGLSAQIVDGGMLRVGDQLNLVLETSE